MYNLLSAVLAYFLSSPTLLAVSFVFSVVLAVCFLIIGFARRF